MLDRTDNWLVLMKHLPGINTSETFISEMNLQLQKKFKELTSKKFDGERFYLFMESPNDLKYFTDNGFSYGMIEAELMFHVGQTHVIITWKSLNGNQQILPSDEVETSTIEFNWEQLDVNDKYIRNLSDSYFDLREKYKFNVPFPVISYSGIIGTEVSLIFKVNIEIDMSLFRIKIGSIINSWNDKQKKEKKNGNSELIHSFNILNSKENEIILYINSHTTDEEVYKFILEEISMAKLPIKQVEFRNG